MHKSQSLLYLTTVLHVSGFTITHLQEHKTTVTTASGNRYTVIKLNFTDKECRQTRLKLQLFNDFPQNIHYSTIVILTLRRLTSYIYGAPILDVSRSHTTTQHSR